MKCLLNNSNKLTVFGTSVVILLCAAESSKSDIRFTLQANAGVRHRAGPFGQLIAEDSDAYDEQVLVETTRSVAGSFSEFGSASANIPTAFSRSMVGAAVVWTTATVGGGLGSTDPYGSIILFTDANAAYFPFGEPAPGSYSGGGTAFVHAELLDGRINDVVINYALGSAFPGSGMEAIGGNSLTGPSYSVGGAFSERTGGGLTVAHFSEGDAQLGSPQTPIRPIPSWPQGPGGGGPTPSPNPADPVVEVIEYTFGAGGHAFASSPEGSDGIEDFVYIGTPENAAIFEYSSFGSPITHFVIPNLNGEATLQFGDHSVPLVEGEPIDFQEFVPSGVTEFRLFTNGALHLWPGIGFTSGLRFASSGPVGVNVLAILDGDYNSNSIVEQADLDLVLLNWGSELADPASAGWQNDLPEGLVDQEELDKVLLNWGNSVESLGAMAVPEPTAVVMALLFLSFVLMNSRAPYGKRSERLVGPQRAR